ncbi:MAG: M50 family metallopeptidase, partial [Candidatus Lokiarchaeota archaeon]|nr:M50 family metallopeptidase [Candidatus Lokiarchaeota archaeon]
DSTSFQQTPTTAQSYSQPTQIVPISQEQTYQRPVTPGSIRGTTDGTYTWYRQESQVPVDAFDPDSGIKFKGILLPHKSELFHFIIGVSLIFIIGILTFYPNLINTGYEWAIFMLAGFYATAFLFHEFGHRQVAVHFGLQTKFRLLTFGMILTVSGLVFGLYSLISGGLGFPSLALPGAVVVLGLSKIDRTTGLCKAAGPIVNLVYGTILFIISFIIPTYPLNQLIGVAASLNFMLGTFNMIPIGILDGQNIWKWNKKIYIALAGSLLILLIITYALVYAPIATNPYIS